MSTTKTTERDILHQLFGWGTGDIDYVLREFDAFEVDPGDVGEYMEGNNFMDEKRLPDVNDVIADLFEIAVRNAGWEDGVDGDKVTSYLNCLDSHLAVDGVEVYSFDELKAEIKRLKKDECPECGLIEGCHTSGCSLDEEAQDRESYSDDQDRESYTVDKEHDGK